MPDRYQNIPLRIDNKKNRYYTNTIYPEITPNINDVYVLTEVGDRLDTLANDYYQDTSLWWVISRANPDKIKRTGLLVEPGLQIRIPSNIQNILSDFENLNTEE